MARRRQKPGNGEGRGNAFLLSFNLDDPDERRAWEMAQQLARPHGKRAHVLKSFLLALADHQQETGAELNADTLSARLLAGLLFGQDVLRPVEPTDRSVPKIKMTTANKASAEEVTQNFGRSMASFFDN